MLMDSSFRRDQWPGNRYMKMGDPAPSNVISHLMCGQLDFAPPTSYLRRHASHK